MDVGQVPPGQLIKYFNPGSFQRNNAQANSSNEKKSSLLSGLDSLDLNPDTASTIQYARSQFEINYRSIEAISNSEGIQVRQTSFSFKASFEFLQVSSGNAPQDIGEFEPESLLDKLKELFSPENTAQRILDFALSFAPQDAEESGRQEFADYIGEAIQKGFDEAQKILGTLEEDIQSGIDKTHELVFDGLAEYIANGLSPDQDEKTSAIQAYAEMWQVSFSSSYTVIAIESAVADNEDNESEPSSDGVQESPSVEESEE